MNKDKKDPCQSKHDYMGFWHATHRDGQTVCVRKRERVRDCVHTCACINVGIQSKWQLGCLRHQGVGMKTNLNQPWPKLCKIIKKKSFADSCCRQNEPFICSLWKSSRRRTHLDCSYSLNQRAGRECDRLQKESARLVWVTVSCCIWMCIMLQLQFDTVMWLCKT